jgi:hypothetical protein
MTTETDRRNEQLSKFVVNLRFGSSVSGVYLR